jgi:type IV pilus assembly protein PilQ
MALALPAAADPPQSGVGTPRSAAIHQISRPANTPNEVQVFVEEIHGALMSDGSLPGVIEIVLTDTYIPEAMAQILLTKHPLIERVQFSESAWGRESEAQISLSVADGVEARTIESDNAFAVVLGATTLPGESFTIRFVKKPFADRPAVEALKGTLNQIASVDPAVETDTWWGEAKAGRAPSSSSTGAVSTATLAAVRDANIELLGVSDSVFAAQGDEAAPAAEEPAAATEEAQSAEDTPAPESPAEGSEPAEEPVVPDPPAKREPPKGVNSAEANKELSKQMLSATESAPAGDAPAAVEKKAWTGSPLNQPVTIDFRDMDLINAVQILADMAQINVIAGTDLVGTVTLNLRNVPLMQAMETALRINGLGIVEEEGIYHIKPYLDAVSSKRLTQVIDITEAKASEIETTLKNVIQGSEYESLISISSNDSANTIIIAGPEGQIENLLVMAKRLDVEQATLPTVTLPIKLNYAEPAQMMTALEGMLTPEIGKVTVDERARVLVVTDIPIVVEQMKDLVKQLDMPVKQVAIDAMIVDVTLTDAADTGVDWLLSAVKNQSRRDAAGDTGIFTGDLQNLSLGADMDIGDAAGLLGFGILTDNIDWRGVIQAEVRNNNSTLLSNPRLITVENQPATITIASEIPYTELTSTEQGGQQTSTEFKPIGTTLEVTPQVTHDDHIIAMIDAKESTSSQVVNGVPVEDLRQINTTPHLASGQTIYVGGLRKNNDTVSIRKIPVLGDIPVVNFLFRSNQRDETVNELLIFLTCSVLEGEPQLTDYQQERVDEVRSVDVKVSAETALINDAVHPSEFRDPAWKWRKNHRPAKGE